MLKKILSLVLVLSMVIAVFALTACEATTEQEVSNRLPTTLNFVGITEASTTPEAVKAVEDAINEITMATFKTKINLTLVTRDQYYDLINERIAQAEYNTNVNSAIATYNRYAQSIANKLSAQMSSSSSGIGKWQRGNVIVEAETIATTTEPTAELTVIDENGIVSTYYPDASSPIDIVMIQGKDMFDYFTEMGLLTSVKKMVQDGTTINLFKQFGQFIYPTFLEQIQSITGDLTAIPTNHILADYTYLIVDTSLAEKYDFNIENFDDYSDLSSFLKSVKENEPDYIPFESEPDPLGIMYPFGEDIAIAAYLDPLEGFNLDEGKSYSIQNLYTIPQYVSHVKLMEDYRSKGYFDANDSGKFAVRVVKGDKSIETQYDDSYELKIIQNPFVEIDVIFDGLMGVTEYSEHADRALEIIQAFNTDPQLKNLLQYGIENEHYKVDAQRTTITKINDSYSMNKYLTGNLYVGYPDVGENPDLWTYAKLTNLDSKLAPSLIKYISDDDLDDQLSDFIYRAELSEALKNVCKISYETFREADNKQNANYKKYIAQLKTHYEKYLKECLIADGIKESAVDSAFNGTIRNNDWYLQKIALKIGESHPEYAAISTANGLKNMINGKISEILGIAYYTKDSKTSSFETYRTNAKDYYNNIESLRIMSKILFDFSEEEIQKYDQMSNVEFENAMIDYVKAHYIEENDLDEEKYDLLVKQYITSEAGTLYDEMNNSYSFSWDDVLKSAKDSEEFIAAMEALKVKYADIIASSTIASQIDYIKPTDFYDELHNLLYRKYISELGTTVSEFQLSVYNEILAPYNMTKSEFDKLRTTNIIDYNRYISQLKSKYKEQILQKYSLERYNESGSSAISASEIMSTILNAVIEEKTQVYHTMASDAGISYDSLISGYKKCYEYKRRTDKVQNAFLYTLQAYYPGISTDKILYSEVLELVYEAVYNYGYYINEVAKLVGLTLTKYTNARSQAQNYINQLTKLIDYFEDDIKAEGYNIDSFRLFNPEDVEEIISSIIRENYYSDIVDVREYLVEVYSEYIDGYEAADDKSKYVTNAGKEIDNNYFLTSVIGTLEDDLNAYIIELSDK